MASPRQAMPPTKASATSPPWVPAPARATGALTPGSDALRLLEASAQQGRGHVEWVPDQLPGGTGTRTPPAEAQYNGSSVTTSFYASPTATASTAAEIMRRTVDELKLLTGSGLVSEGSQSYAASSREVATKRTFRSPAPIEAPSSLDSGSYLDLPRPSPSSAHGSLMHRRRR